MHFSLQEAENYLKKQGLWDALHNAPETQLPADWVDLARLHYLVRKRKAFTILEFGVGRSTTVLADALYQNRTEWDSLLDKPNILRDHASFRLYAVDASVQWIENAKRLLPVELAQHVEFHYAEVQAGTFKGRMCHYYTTVPDVVPDFIYLDAPAPEHVEGAIHGLSWKTKTPEQRPPIAADILVMEPTLLPGTFVLIDGRTTNARFLANNVQRRWRVAREEKEDVTTMELQEPPLGETNRAQLIYCLGYVQET